MEIMLMWVSKQVTLDKSTQYMLESGTSSGGEEISTTEYWLPAMGEWSADSHEIHFHFTSTAKNRYR